MTGDGSTSGAPVADPVTSAPPSAEEEAEPAPSRSRRARPERDGRTQGIAARSLGKAKAKLASLPRRAAKWLVDSLPMLARVLRVLGVAGVLFVLFVVVFGAMRHTARQAHLDDAFRVRVASGHAAGPNWRPLPGQAMATVSIPAIGLREVVVQDTTPELLQGGPGHLINTPLPGHVGNSVILGRRVTDGAAFRHLADVSVGDAITVVTPQGAFAYSVTQVSHVAPGQPDVLGPTSDSRLTLVTSGSWFVSRNRLVVVAALTGTPLPPAPVPLIQLRSDQLGQAGNSDAFVSLLPWALAMILALLAWRRVRRRIASRGTRFVMAVLPVLVLLYFLFENAARLLPGTI